MRKSSLFAILALSILSGCSSIRGPIETRHLPRADAPGYTIPQQEARGRQRYTITEDDWSIGPKAYIDRPSPIGR
ncbi:MAG TPA: hypothetical protein VLM40_20305 [Gemmata sp.]|nr:hypothetical protein [Gemmata sp.]